MQGVHKSETMNVKAGRYDFMRFALRSIEVVEKLTDFISGGKLLWGPSLEVIAVKR
ncbi:MAG: hypothetical protein SRB1_02438 [Desulfobacteraceae bacterium Eth-SRB1]|nr:MAG: hypothetical protein SRB1_02438 [Desulfobacteraceae bacterium Eth-SRB1]